MEILGILRAALKNDLRHAHTALQRAELLNDLVEEARDYLPHLTDREGFE